MNKYTVVANDDAMKYQVINEREGKKTVLFEHDGQNEAEYICDMVREAYLQGIKDRESEVK